MPRRFLRRLATLHICRIITAAVSLLAASARADWTITTVDFKQLEHMSINTWNPTEGLSATDLSGKMVTFKTRDILSLNSGQRLSPAQTWKLELRSGDVISGTPVKVSGQSILFNIRDLDGDLAFPLKRATSLTAPSFVQPGAPKRTLPVSLIDDLIIYKQGDNLAGIFLGIDSTNVSFGTGANATPSDIPLANIDSIVFGGARPPRTVPPLSVRFTFPSGTVMTVPAEGGEAFNWTPGKLMLKDAGNKMHEGDARTLVSAEVIGGRVIYLTELDMASEQQVSFLGTKWPAQINKNVLGQPMRVGHTNYDAGIGVHTQSTLVYDLDGSFDTLTLRVGLDDSAAPNGEALASIVLDGKVIWQTPADKPLKPGDISAELSLPITKGKRLELHADPSTKLDVQGRVDWINVALHR